MISSKEVSILKTANYNIRLDPEIKAKAEKIFSEFGLNLSDAINVFLHMAIKRSGFPFEIRENIPNAEFQAAIDECDAMINGKIPKPPVMTVAEFVDDMKAWADDEKS